MFSRIVGTFRAATQDDVYVPVATRFDDSGYALFRNAHERVGVAAGAHRVDGNCHTAIGAILEANWERHARSEFAMELRFCSARPNCTPRNEVVQILWRNRIQEL